MPTTDLHYLTLTELARRLHEREISPVEVTQAMLDRIENVDRNLESYVTVLPESALARAKEAEAEIARGNVRGRLHGVPIAIKDLCSTKGVRTTCGTAVLSDWVPGEDATVVERLRDAGAIVLGKLKLTEGPRTGSAPRMSTSIARVTRARPTPSGQSRSSGSGKPWRSSSTTPSGKRRSVSTATCWRSSPSTSGYYGPISQMERCEW